MSAAGVTASRTAGRTLRLPSAALSAGGFLAAAGAAFAFAMARAEGCAAAVAPVWAAAVAPLAPVLAALLGMDVWSGERHSGRIDLLLSAPVRERDLVLGKFLGVWLLTVALVAVSLVSSLAVLRAFAPRAAAEAGIVSFLPAFAGIALQCAVWSAVSVAASAAFRHAAAAALATVTLLVAVPRGLWLALLKWAPQGASAFGEMPFDAHAFDFASGVVSSGVVLPYVFAAAAALFVCTSMVAALRYAGRRAALRRAGAAAVSALALVLAVLVSAVAVRLDATLELPLPSSAGLRFSDRMRGVLAESRGTIEATCFLPRSDPRFRPVAARLRAFRREAASLGGAAVALGFVDPRWDFGPAQRLVREGVPADSVVLSRGTRRAVLPLADGLGERELASAVLRLTKPPQRRCVYWTRGHGEASFGDYGLFGMSDIARELARDGYRNLQLDLSSDAPIPSDCALVVAAGAKEDFSRAEAGRLDSYLKQGGRLLVLVGAADGGGLASVLSTWGIRPGREPLGGARTMTGGDVVASDFGRHPVTDPLAGAQVVLERPATFEPSSAAAAAAGADGIAFTPLVSAGGRCVAAAAERGGGAGTDIALRPTRIVAVGDALFAMNGPLASRANANRDFFMNCVAHLAGTGAMTSGGTGFGTVITGMDRSERVRFALWSSAAAPGLVFLLMLLPAVAGRSRR